MACQPKSDYSLTSLFKRQLLAARCHRPATRSRTAFFKQRLHTKITNETDETIVLRAKYRDVWEGERVKLESRKWAMVPWTPEVYKRLGAFVETDAGQASVRPLFISNEAMGENDAIAITHSSCNDSLQVKNEMKRPR